MLKTAKKIFSLGIKAAKLTRKEIEKEVNAMVKSGAINKNEGKELLGKIIAEAKQEKDNFQKFLKQEVQNEMRKAKPLMKEMKLRGKKAVARARPKLRKLAKKAMAEARKGANVAKRKVAKRASQLNSRRTKPGAAIKKKKR